MPVMFPSGRLRLATKPRPTGSSLLTITIGNVLVACGADRGIAFRDDQIDLLIDEFCGERRQPVEAPLCMACDQDEIAGLGIAHLLKRPDKRRFPFRLRSLMVEPPDPPWFAGGAKLCDNRRDERRRARSDQ
jgi:hypothetical protein